MLKDVHIKALKPENGKTKRKAISDGLFIEARSSGKKVFIFRFQWNQKPQTITLGYYPSLGLGEARSIALDNQTLLHKGVDPREKDSKESNQLTFREVAERWHKTKCARLKEVTQKRHYKSLVRDVYPSIGDKPIDNITKSELLNIIQPHELKGHYEVSHRLHSRLKSIFDFATGSSLTENYPFMGLKSVMEEKPPVTNQPAISPNEAHEMLDAIKNSSVSRINKIYIELLAHVFTRPSELRLAKWSEFDLQQAEWYVPADRMKMKVAHWVPLSVNGH